jgi:TetR/AcrR family transcriptional regulator, multidrug resistance operon repressor
LRTRDAKKEQVIRAKALEMIVKTGLDGFSMPKLARAAKVSPATLYIYFKHRDDLIFQIYREQMDRMAAETLAGFDPDSTFAEGLRVQWKNRARYALAHPLESQFLEQIRHSPYFQKFSSKIDQTFSLAMRRFAINAVQRREIVRVTPELFWCVAYAPLYNLLRFHQLGTSLFNRTEPPEKFQLNEALLEQALGLVLKALRP